MVISKELERQVAKAIAQSWLDERFRDRFLEQPKAVLEEAGIELEPFVELQFARTCEAAPVLKGTADGNVIYEIPLPRRPDGLSDEQIHASLADASDRTQITRGCCST